MSTAAPEVQLRAPRLNDGKAVHELIAASPPLDLNSSYSYFLLCSHFADTCVVAERDGQVAGFLSAYLIPNDMHSLFIWQIAVDASLRGQGMAGRMLEAVLARPACAAVRALQTTVSPSNRASRRVFERFAEQHGLRMEQSVFLHSADFGAENHEQEILFHIGPLT